MEGKYPSNPPTTHFPETRWTLVLEAGKDADCSALEELCKTYWYPLYAFARRQGLAKEDSQDVTQGFFADLLRREDLRQVAREKGRFRSFMLAGLRNFIANDFRKNRRLKRGGSDTPISIDEEHGEERFKLEPASEETPETLFEKNWAIAVLQLAMDKLHEEYANAGRLEMFGELRAFLPTADRPPTFPELAKRLGMGVSAATMTVHRMRQRFGAILKDELRHTVTSEEELTDELRHLLKVIGR